MLRSSLVRHTAATVRLSARTRTPVAKVARSATQSAKQQRRQFSAHLPVTTFSDEENMLRETVRKFAVDRIQPLVQEMDETQTLDRGLLKEMFDQGLMGIEIPADYDGGDMSFTSSIIAIEELARIDPAVAVVADVQNTLVNNIFFRFAREEQKQQWLPRLATDTVGSFCLSESGSGSDAFALKTRAELKGNEWELNGSKMWITNAKEAGVFIVMANVDPSKGYKGITAFIVERDNPGIHVANGENKLGIRASSTCEVVLDKCRVPESAVMGEVGKGYKIAIETLNEGRIGIGSQMLGLARGALDLTLPYINERKQFGQSIASFQGVQFIVAQAAVEIEAARLLVYNAARKKEAGENFIQAAAMSKLYASQVAERVASHCVDLMGGIGFTKDAGVEKFFRDSKIGKIYEGTTNVQLQTIAKDIAKNGL